MQKTGDDHCRLQLFWPAVLWTRDVNVCIGSSAVYLYYVDQGGGFFVGPTPTLEVQCDSSRWRLGPSSLLECADSASFCSLQEPWNGLDHVPKQLLWNRSVLHQYFPVACGPKLSAAFLRRSGGQIMRQTTSCLVPLQCTKSCARHCPRRQPDNAICLPASFCPQQGPNLWIWSSVEFVVSFFVRLREAWQ